jgi:hypothetical protein
MLACERRDPDIVVRNWPANSGKFRFDLTVRLSRSVVGKQDYRVSQNVADVTDLFLPPPGSLRAEIKFTENRPRQVHGSDLCKPWRESWITAKVGDHNGGVQQDTTSCVHLLARNLPR